MKIRPVAAKLIHAERRTDRKDKCNRCFPQLWDHAKNWILKECVGKCWVLSFGSGYGKIAGCCENCNEPSYPQKAWVYLIGWILASQERLCCIDCRSAAVKWL